MSKLTKSELADAEALLMKKYRGIVRNSLTNTGKDGKRTIKLRCEHGHTFITHTCEIFHAVCPTCGEPIQTKSRRKASAK